MNKIKSNNRQKIKSNVVRAGANELNKNYKTQPNTKQDIAQTHSIKAKQISPFTPYYDTILPLFNSIKKNDEFEIDLNKAKNLETNTFYNVLTYTTYFKLLQFISKFGQKGAKIINTQILDINYTVFLSDVKHTYRLSVNNADAINRYHNSISKYNSKTIFNIILNDYTKNQTITKKDSIDFIKKIRYANDIIDISDLNIRIRKSTEQSISLDDIKYLEDSVFDSNNIIFRLKNRISVILHDNNYNLRIDLTSTQQHKEMNLLHNALNNYEIEVECFNKTSQILDKIILDKQLALCTTLIKIIQSSNYIITKTEEREVIQKYNELLPSSIKKIKLDSTQVSSIEIRDLENLSNKYAVTDKADGDHAFLIIKNSEVYLIGQNLNVTKTGIIVNNSAYDNTILDGELIYLKKKNKYLFLIFDCLYYCDNNVQDEVLFYKRIDYANDVVLNCFVNDKQQFKGIKQDFKMIDIDKIIDFYSKNIVDYFDIINKDIDNININEILIRPKIFLFPYGIKDNEIYKYSKLFWNLYKQIDTYPYFLDGLILQPINQSYRSNQLSIIKWKPEENNSIDFYISFVRDKDTGKILDIYDNIENSQQYDDMIENKNTSTVNNNLYRICHLHVGSSKNRNVEYPVLFNPKEDNPNNNVYIAKLLIDPKTKTIRDAEGHIVQDKTVVEFYYKHDVVEPTYRWMPMRTRFDKTEQVQKYQKGYGNNEMIANKIWFSIKHPVKFSDIELLADDTKYINHKSSLLSSIADYRSQNVPYYEANNRLLNPYTSSQRRFHNDVKTILLNTYCRPEFNNNKKVKVMDIGIGRGGDVEKYYNAKVASVTGIDPDYNGLHSPEGAIARYRRNTFKYPGFPPFSIINADITLPFDTDAQLKSIPDTSANNKLYIDKYLSGKIKYDVLSSQFAFHYFLKDEISWNNTCNNINKVLNNDGVLLFTTFDGRRVTKLLKENNGLFEQHFIINGIKVLFHGIKQLYKDIDESKEVYGPGNKIDICVGRFSSEYITEYIVDEHFIIPELQKKCNLYLVETGYFEDIYNELNIYTEEIADIENKPDMKKHLIDAKKFFENNTYNDETKKITFLNRYYIFKKINS